jgi:hypothetical protein
MTMLTKGGFVLCYPSQELIMEAYKFEVIVQEDGIIKIPEISRFANQEVEVLIIVKPKAEIKPDLEKAVEKFLNKWSGVLKDADPD